MRLRALLGCMLVLAAGLAASAAADPESIPLCPSAGTQLEGSYGNLTITGNAYVAAGTSLSVRGNLTLAPGACLDAFSLGTVTVGRNILVGNGATLALGCSPGALGPPLDQAPCDGQTTSDTVGGNIVAHNPWTMYLTADTIGGNVISTGGGPGVTFDPYVNFPIKENTIGGNLIVQDWHGAWFGELRNHVQGNVIIDNVLGANPDSNEVTDNVIGKNLICFDNSPMAQVGDSGGGPNSVSGQQLGQCSGL
jgi:hypothetical protein